MLHTTICVEPVRLQLFTENGWSELAANMFDQASCQAELAPLTDGLLLRLSFSHQKALLIVELQQSGPPNLINISPSDGM